MAATSVSSEDALKKAVEEGKEIKLTKSIELKTMITVPAGQKVIIDLNGKTIDRAVSESIEGGSVFLVENKASLTITDSSSSPGVITGGAAVKGGGICNYGTLTIENGIINGNKSIDETEGFGGGIYNAEGGTLILKGGKITDNRARCGGGIYNAKGAVMTVLQGSYKKKIGSIVTTVTTNAVIYANKATEAGGAIYNAGDFSIQDSPIFEKNTAGDIFLENAFVSITGTLTLKNKLTVMASKGDTVIIKGLAKSGAKQFSDIFEPAAEDAHLVLDTDGNVVHKNGLLTMVLVYKGDKLTESKEFETVADAWKKAADNMASGKKVEIILGSDWEEDEQLNIAKDSNVTLDLNGRYIKRKRNKEQISDGGLFRVYEGATFTIKDSNPQRKSYEGIRGGVITGGASSNSSGGIQLEKNTTLNIYGGTIYECFSCDDGGGICAHEAGVSVTLKNCSIRYCQVIDSINFCLGGGMIVSSDVDLTMENVTIEDCYSEDSGGGLYLGCRKNKVRLKNVTFSGNTAYDNGGAMELAIYNGADFRAEGCTFINNNSRDRGGCVYFDSSEESDGTAVFNGCTFTGNTAGSNGSALYVSGNGIVLLDCTITGNTVENDSICGAVFVYEGLNISLGGLTVIKDNKTGHSFHKNLVLNRVSDTYAKIYCAGLEAGSYIAFSLKNVAEYNKKSGAFTPVRNVTEYQTRYFHAESGDLSFLKEGQAESPMVTSSVFGIGSAWVLVITAVMFAAIFAAALIIKKKKAAKGGNDNENI